MGNSRLWGVTRGRRPQRGRGAPWPLAAATTIGALAWLAGCGGDNTTEVSAGPVTVDTSAADTTLVASDGSDPDLVQTGSTTSAPASTTVVSSTPTSDVTSIAPGDGEISWQSIGDGLESGSLDVPVDYDAPGGAKFSLYLVRHRATDPGNRIGTLLVNPGGPGFPGSGLARDARSRFGAELLARFDIVGWDPRGTGNTTPAVDCIDDYDRFFTSIDHTPEGDDEHQLVIDRAEEFAAACAERSGSELSYVGTNNSARDIDAIRRALGEDQISYFGFSYGSELGATWVTLFPKTVRAAVLDGARDPAADDRTATEQQMVGFQASIQRFLEHCSRSGCAFSGDRDPEQAYLELMEQLDANPLSVSSNRPPVNRDVARFAVAYSMYSDDNWGHLDLSLQAAENGDGSGLLTLYDRYYARRKDGTYPNYLEAFQAIRCADDPTRESVQDSDALTARMAVAAPLIVPSGTVEYECTFFTPAVDPRVEIDGGGTTAPILVIGTTGDPATPLASSKQMAAAIPGASFLQVDANRHTGYRVNRCSVGAVNNLLINLTTPETDKTC